MFVSVSNWVHYMLFHLKSQILLMTWSEDSLCIPQFVYPLICWEAFELCISRFAIVNIAAINTFVQVSVSVLLFFFFNFFSSFGCLLRSWISGSCGNSTFSFWRNYQIVFRGGCTILYSYQQTLIVLFHSNFSTKEMITFLSVLDAFLGYLSCFQTIF